MVHAIMLTSILSLDSLDHATRSPHQYVCLYVQRLFLVKAYRYRTKEVLYFYTHIAMSTRWEQPGITVAGDSEPGSRRDQLFWPQGIYLTGDQTVYVADYGNNRISRWKSNTKIGDIVAGRNGYGRGTDQLNQPTYVFVDENESSLIICDWGNRRVVQRSLQNDGNEHIVISDVDCSGLTMDTNGNLYVSNYKHNEVRQWKKGETNGRIVAGGHGRGEGLDQLNSPTSIFVAHDQSLYVSDNNNHRVIKWLNDAKQGIVVAGGHGRGNSLRQLSNPHSVWVDHLGNVYVADFGNDRVVCWCPGSREGSLVLGGNDKGKQANQFDGPIGISFDSQGNCYVVDHRNNRVQKFVVNCN